MRILGVGLGAVLCFSHVLCAMSCFIASKKILVSKTRKKAFALRGMLCFWMPIVTSTRPLPFFPDNCVFTDFARFSTGLLVFVDKWQMFLYEGY